MSARGLRLRVHPGRVRLPGWLQEPGAQCIRPELFQVVPEPPVEHRDVRASPRVVRGQPSEPVLASVHVLAGQVEHRELCPVLAKIRVA